MSDEPFYKPNRKPAPPRQPEPGELLFEFVLGSDRWRCELRDHGDKYGVEAQFLLTLTARAHAVQWAEEERKALLGKRLLVFCTQMSV